MRRQKLHPEPLENRPHDRIDRDLGGQRWHPNPKNDAPQRGVNKWDQERVCRGRSQKHRKFRRNALGRQGRNHDIDNGNGNGNGELTNGLAAIGDRRDRAGRKLPDFRVDEAHPDQEQYRRNLRAYRRYAANQQIEDDRNRSEH